jgi:hypothetical protein
MDLKAIGAVACAVMLAACGSDPCSKPSPCPNDVMKTPAQIDQCRASLDANKNAPCYQLALATGECIQSSTVCTAGGTTDGALTITKASNNCKNQIDASTSCCMTNASSSACQ